MGSVSVFGVVVPVDRLIATASALALTCLLYLLLRRSRVGRAIVAVRLDRDAAVLMGVDVKSIYAIAFGLGAALAGCAGVADGVDFPDLAADVVGLSRARPSWFACSADSAACPARWPADFCWRWSKGSDRHSVGPAHATTLSFCSLIVFLIVRPQGLLGPKGL